MISFIHHLDESAASWRYRLQVGVSATGATINDPSADQLIFCKPQRENITQSNECHYRGGKTIVDICDWHFDKHHYCELVKISDLVTCPTQWMASWLRMDFGVEAVVIPDGYEFEEVEPHYQGSKCLWFGNATNFPSIEGHLEYMTDIDLHLVSNVSGHIPWSLETMREEFRRADIVLMPETAPYKSANRAIESLRQGCFVVAEPHPSLSEFQNFIYIGSLRKGIEWAQQNPSEANTMIRLGQAYIRERFSPRTLETAWRNAAMTALTSILVAAKSTGKTGSTVT